MYGKAEDLRRQIIWDVQTGADGRKIDIPASLGQGFQSTESRTLMQARKLFEKVMGGVSFQSKDMQ